MIVKSIFFSAIHVRVIVLPWTLLGYIALKMQLIPQVSPDVFVHN